MTSAFMSNFYELGLRQTIHDPIMKMAKLWHVAATKVFSVIDNKQNIYRCVQVVPQPK